MPQVMDLDHSYARVDADAAEGANEVARLDRPAGFGGVDETVVLPGLAKLTTVRLLCRAAQVQHFDGLGK